MQVDFGEGPETEHRLHLTASGYSPFRHTRAGVPAIDPSLDQSTGASRNAHGAAQSHLLQSDNASSIVGGQLSHGFYGDMSRSSPIPPNASPARQPKQVVPTFVPDDRAPPPRDVSDETIGDAYAAFILYCNPNFPTTIDTSELVKLFRTPPKSDGNAFSIWTLFELIRKFDAKEITTWTKLALDLGVAPPDTEKGQSTQKVQQYSVRLKRWMRAMHIDAFFEYLLGKQHPYYLQIPLPHNPFPDGGRDGVPLEEDLAIRALDPKFKPKRGRRKADDGEEEVDMDEGTPARKRPQLDTSIPFGNALQPQSAYPTSAHPDNMGGFLTPHDPWTATSSIAPSSVNPAPGRMGQKNLTPYSASPMSGQQIRWRLNPHDHATTPHPLSAVTPQSAQAFFDEPQSAVTPSSARPRARRRHGPAVSSAWSNNSGSSSGKLRGRPPSNRSVRDGPFVTFPANPRTREGPTIDMHRNHGNLTPIVERAQSDPPGHEHTFRFPPTPASAVSLHGPERALHSATQRPHRLSLQVPQNPGNPVRLVTPTVLVNGEQSTSPETNVVPLAVNASSVDDSPASVFDHDTYHGSLTTPLETRTQSQGRSPRRPQTQSSPSTGPLPHIALETLNRALAAELIRAPLTGRRKRLRGSEAKNLASSVLQPLYAKTTCGPAPAMSEAVLSIAISSCLGLSSAVGLGIGGPNGGVRRVECVRFRVGGDGYESPIEEESEDGAEEMQDGAVKETFDVFFGVGFGGLAGEWVAKGLVATAGEGEEREGERGVDEEGVDEGWKGKFVEAQRRLWESQEEVKRLKDRILEAVL